MRDDPVEAPWRQRLVDLIDAAIEIGIDLRNDQNGLEPDKVLLTRALFVLAKLREKTVNCHLPTPNGLTTLGIARGVLDFIDDRYGRLVQAAGAIERHYLTVPVADPRFPPLSPLTEFSCFADGSTKPPVPDGQPVITLQDRDVFTVGIWRRGDFGGHKESPVNEQSLAVLARDLILGHAPELLDRVTSTSITCPPEIAEQMVWPEDKV
jgi:hypothetical protein